MLWHSPLLAAATGASAPLDSAVTAILGYGPLGVIALALSWLIFKGWRLIPPSREGEIRAGVREDARADLIRERDRVIAEKGKPEDQRDEAMKIAQTEIAPLLLQFTATSGALLPLLQELVSRREGRERDTGRR